MTDLVSKQHIIAALEQTLEGLTAVRPVCDIVATMGDPRSAAFNAGAQGVVSALLDGIVSGVYDATDENVLAECAVVRYSEDVGDDTEDMDDIAPEEEPGSGIIMLPPSPTSEEQEELYQWAASNGFIVKFFKV